MNTDRDNFHDWAREKPDTTSFSGLHHLERRHPQPSMNWGRMGFWIVLAGLLGAGFKYFFST